MRTAILVSWVVMLSACRSREAAPETAASSSLATPPASSWGTVASAVVAPRAPCGDGRVLVPGGTFRMGSADGDKLAAPDERPAHDVTLAAFCVDRTEVTVARYAACAAAGACSPASKIVVSSNLSAADIEFWSRFCNAGIPGREQHPVNCVDWKQASDFCAFAGGRLPTEAEWERAARGDDGRAYPWGNEPPSATRLNACGAECGVKAIALGGRAKQQMYEGDDGAETTAPVGSYPAGASPFGALDMAGNVWEWTADGYAPYAAGASDNPRNDRGPLRVVRGGHWLNTAPSSPRAAHRSKRPEDRRLEDMGLRCVAKPAP